MYTQLLYSEIKGAFVLYIRKTAGEAGAYPPPQSLKAKGLLFFPDEFLEEFISYNGFVSLEVEGEKVTAITPNLEAWEAWKAQQAEAEETSATYEDNKPVTWEELDTAYNEGRDSAYDS